MGSLLEELKKATTEEEIKKLKEQIEFFNAAGYTVAKTSYNEVVNENYFLKKEIEQLKEQLEKMKNCGNCKKYELNKNNREGILYCVCCKLIDDKKEKLIYTKWELYE